MKAFLGRQAQRIDALSLRERAIMFVSLAVALVAAADALVLSPRMAEQQALSAALRGRASALEALRARLAEAGSAADTPVARLQRSLARTRAEAAQTEAAIAEHTAAGAANPQLPDLLQRALRRQERLTLLHLATAAGPAPRVALGIPMQAVDLGVRGAYLDLAQYVAETERELPGLRWGELAITRSGAEAELAARVYLPGASR
jgi:MSHA biogenesis protein MshJ